MRERVGMRLLLLLIWNLVMRLSVIEMLGVGTHRTLDKGFGLSLNLALQLSIVLGKGDTKN